MQTREKRLEKAKRCITCVGDVRLTETEIFVLAKGLKFVPTESRPNRNRLLKEFDSFASANCADSISCRGATSRQQCHTNVIPMHLLPGGYRPRQTVVHLRNTFARIREKLGIYWESTMGRNPILKKIFPKFPIVAYKRASNLAQQIVRNKLPSSSN